VSWQVACQASSTRYGSCPGGESRIGSQRRDSSIRCWPRSLPLLPSRHSGTIRGGYTQKQANQPYAFTGVAPRVAA
jgi:hypothetical protein